MRSSDCRLSVSFISRSKTGQRRGKATVMIKLMRIDYRLIHGQVAMAWTSAIGANCLLVANDAVSKDSMRITTLKLARPAGCKLVIKSVEDSITALNSGVTDPYNLFIIVESVEDAYRLAKGYRNIRSINFGGAKPQKDCTRKLSVTTPVSECDMQLLKELVNEGIEIEIRQVPGDEKINVSKLL